MKILRNILLGLAAFVLILLVIFLAGPKPPEQHYSDALPALSSDLGALSRSLAASEISQAVRPGNEAQIVFADSTKPAKTHYALVYVHGFSASHEEGAPLHTEFANRYHCNLYLSRLEGHGLVQKPGDSSAFAKLQAEALYASAVRALAYGCKLGDSVILMGTSAGGALSLMLAAREKHLPIKTLILYSPCVKIFDPNAVLLDKHWGLQIAHMVTGKTNVVSQHNDSLSRRYWYHSYRLEGAVALQKLLDDNMNAETFGSLKLPVLTCMYYKDLVHQDSTVSTKAIIAMVKDLGTPLRQKPLVLVPGAGDHVICSYIRSHDLETVRKATFSFADEILHLAH